MAKERVLIAALDEGGLIGRRGAMPWHLPKDLQRFRRLTVGHTVLMGRRTFESIGRPLPERDNWVVSRNPAFHPRGARVFADVDAALAAHREGALFIIGGAQLYRAAFPVADRLELTRIHARLDGEDGDARFPDFDAGKWREIGREDHAADARHAYPYSFVTLVPRAKMDPDRASG